MNLTFETKSSEKFGNDDVEVFSFEIVKSITGKDASLSSKAFGFKTQKAGEDGVVLSHVDRLKMQRAEMLKAKALANAGSGSNGAVAGIIENEVETKIETNPLVLETSAPETVLETPATEKTKVK